MNLYYTIYRHKYLSNVTNIETENNTHYDRFSNNLFQAIINASYEINLGVLEDNRSYQINSTNRLENIYIHYYF